MDGLLGSLSTTIMKIIMLTAFAAMAISGSASASTITYSTYTATGAADISWVISSTGVASANFGGSDVTFGGVNWEGSQTNGHIATQTYVDVGGYQFYHSDPGSAWGINQPSLFYPTTPTVGLLHSGTTVSSASARIDINGLTIGQQYMATLVFADSRSTPGGTNMTLTAALGDSGSSASTRYSYNDGKYLVVTATWTASRAGVSFTPSIDGGTASQLNAAQIVAVPEPSVALLAALVPLALLRRKR